MQNLMPPIDTTDHAFHDGDPTTGQLGTIVTAAWLNDVQGATRDIQAEIIAVLTKAGMQPNPQKQNQLAEAISQIIGSGGYATSGDLTLGLSKKIDKADIAQQLGNDTTKVPSLHLVATELGKKASIADANSKLAKDKNGADIPDKEAFIGNLGLPELFADGKRFHTSPESVEMITPNGSIIIELTNNGYVNIINKSTGLLAEIPPTGLEQQSGVHPKRMMSQKGVTDLAKSVETPVGMFATFPHRATQLPPKWYSTNGDRFSVSSPQGLVLKSLPAELKSDWGITESGGMINVPNIKQSDGRTPFLRPVNGTERQVGSVDGDKMRRMQGEYANSSWRDPGGGWGGASGVFGVRYATGTSGTAGSNQGTTLVFDSEKVVPTGAEFKPLDIGVTLAIYLGV